jgi:hypothetical protein
MEQIIKPAYKISKTVRGVNTGKQKSGGGYRLLLWYEGKWMLLCRKGPRSGKSYSPIVDEYKLQIEYVESHFYGTNKAHKNIKQIFIQDGRLIRGFYLEDITNE